MLIQKSIKMIMNILVKVFHKNNKFLIPRYNKIRLILSSKTTKYKIILNHLIIINETQAYKSNKIVN